MKTKEEIELLSDDALIEYSKEIKEISIGEIESIQFDHNLPGGVTNSFGKGREYMNSDLESYYNAFIKIVNKYILPIEREVKKRISGSESFYSEFNGKTYNGFNLERLEYFGENIPNAYIGRLSPAHTNPGWYTHLKKIKRFYKQDDYQEKIKGELRENKLNDLLNE